jgi:hypothetical protein
MSRAQHSYGQGKTTVEVAAEIEARFHVVETFWDLEENGIVEMLEDALADDIEDVMAMSKVSRKGISVKETDKIESRFRQNLTARKYDGVISGVPTKASLRGVSHLRQNPYAARNSRPSFLDTGMYSRSFRAWVEDVDD